MAETKGMKSISFVTHWGQDVGMGHAQRCFQVALEMGRKGWAVNWWSPSVSDPMDQNPHRVWNWLKEGPPKELMASDLIFFDTYSLGEESYEALLKGSKKIAVFDDIAPLQYRESLVINYGFGDLEYGSSNHVLRGPEYFPSSMMPEETSEEGSGIWICLGGSAQGEELLQKILPLVEDLVEDHKVNVICGDGIEVNSDRTQVHSWMEQAKFIKSLRSSSWSIIGGGTTLFSAFLSRTPVVVLQVAANQGDNLKGMERMGFAKGVIPSPFNSESFKKALSWIQNEENRVSQRRAFQKLVDGKGVERIGRELENWVS